MEGTDLAYSDVNDNALEDFKEVPRLKKVRFSKLPCLYKMSVVRGK